MSRPLGDFPSPEIRSVLSEEININAPESGDTSRNLQSEFENELRAADLAREIEDISDPVDPKMISEDEKE